MICVCALPQAVLLHVTARDHTRVTRGLPLAASTKEQSLLCSGTKRTLVIAVDQKSVRASFTALRCASGI